MSDAKLLDLGQKFEVYDKYFWEYCEGPPRNNHKEQIAAEKKLDALGEGLFESILSERAETAEGIAVKIAAILHANKSGELSWEDRFDEAHGHSDAVAWSIVRDLVENPSLLNRIKGA